MIAGKFAFTVSLLVSTALVAQSALPAFLQSPSDEGYDLREFETPGTPGPLQPFSGETPRVTNAPRPSTRDTVLRGGRYTPAQIDNLEAAIRLKRLVYGDEGSGFVIASMALGFTMAYPGQNGNGGGGYPGESIVGGWNSQNGNKLTEVNVVSWSARGNTGIDLTLFHNSSSSDLGLFGESWTSTYETIILTSGTSRIVKYADGSSIIFTSGGGGSYVAPAGCFDTLSYNSGTSKYTLLNKDQSSMTFNSSGFLTSMQDRSGNAVDVTYSSAPMIDRVTDESGRYLEFSYNGSSCVDLVEDSTGREWIIDTTGKVLNSIQYPAIKSGSHTDAFTYNGANQITAWTDKRGYDWLFTYDGSGRLATEEDPTGVVETYSYNQTVTIGGSSVNGCTVITDENSKTRAFAYGTFGSISAVQYEKDEANYYTEYLTYNTNYLPLTMNDERGKTWTYTWDSAGNRLTLKNPLNHTWTYTYTAKNDIDTITTPLSKVTDYGYNGSDLVSQVKDPMNRYTYFDYDAYGQIDKVTDNDSEDVDITRNSNGDVTAVQNQLSITTTVGYDSLGRLTSETLPESRGDTYDYDDWGRIETVTHQDNTTVEFEYDAEDNVVSVTNERGKITEHEYDAAGRLTETTNANAEVETYVYDNLGRLSTVTNAKSETRTYAYTDRHELYSLTMPDYASGKKEWYGYDGNGNVVSKKNPLDQITYYTFDDANRQTAVDFPTGNDATFSYDNDNRLTSTWDNSGTTTIQYNDASQVTSHAGPNGTQTYTYDTLGRRKRTNMSGVGSGYMEYSYDTGSRVTGILDTDSHSTSFEYDDANRLTKQTFGNGMWTTFTYDDRDRQTSAKHYKAGPTLVSEETYSYGSNGNLDSAVKNGTTTTYGYDDIDQLLHETISGDWKQEYSYDANGNRASFKLSDWVSGAWSTLQNDSYTYGVGDRLTAAGSKTFSYDGCGRMKTVTVGGTLQRTYHYDYQDRLITTQYPDGTGTSDTYVYNIFNSRTRLTLNGTQWNFRRDGLSATAPVLQDATSSTTNTYVPGVSQKQGSTKKYMGPDRMGSVSHEFDSSSNTSYTADFDAFGRVKSSTGSTTNRFGFAGQWGYQSDPSSDLQLLGNRYYDPSIGRFITRDPIKSGRNWFTYCGNRPLRSVDPFGLFPQHGQFLPWLEKLLGQERDPANKKVLKDVIRKYKTDKGYRDKMHDRKHAYLGGGDEDDDEPRPPGGGRHNPNLKPSELRQLIADMEPNLDAEIPATDPGDPITDPQGDQGLVDPQKLLIGIGVGALVIAGALALAPIAGGAVVVGGASRLLAPAVLAVL
ncbi:MAG: RHS repeat protein [Chthonomonas sp.]|nr:RHS repeat protein [Chthonomonas sp.]